MKQIAFFIMLVSYATVVSSSPDITFHGNLIAPPTCIVSENKTIAFFPSNVFKASRAFSPWYKSLGNVNLCMFKCPPYFVVTSYYLVLYYKNSSL